MLKIVEKIVCETGLFISVSTVQEACVRTRIRRVGVTVVHAITAINIVIVVIVTAIGVSIRVLFNINGTLAISVIQ